MSIERFLAGYARAFASKDLTAVARHFHSPVQVVSETEAGLEATTADREEWHRILQRLLTAYRRLNVASAHMDGFRASDLGGGQHVTWVRWALRRPDKSLIYQFEASYWLRAEEDRFRITALAHNERPKLEEALSRLPSSAG